MGKVVKEKKKKKKGRPSLLDLQKRNLREQQQQQKEKQLLLLKKNNKGLQEKFNSAPNLTANYSSATATALRRSNRRNLNPSPERIAEEDEDEELEGNRREKELKLVLKYLKSNYNASDSDEDANKKRKINAIEGRSGSGDFDKEEKSISGVDENNKGAQLESGLSTPVPDKKLLLFILDRLQKKDPYGVFSEPVDPEELPDYHEVIEKPMDFGTVRKKLTDGAYSSLEDFEKDVFLISSNGMQYNAPDTIYFRQARSIHELAKKNFENLRQDSDDSESETEVVRRGRPPMNNFKKPLSQPPSEFVHSDFSSDATLPSRAENVAVNNHDLRKGTPHLEKSGFADSLGRFPASRNDVYTGRLAKNKFTRNDEVSMSKGYSMKHGKKQFVFDENRRNTYKQMHQSAREPYVFTTFDAERKQLMTVGPHSEHGYARSLARFAANLGTVAWKIAAKRIERCLPAGVDFGPGWVVENDLAPPRLLLLSSPTLGDKLTKRPGEEDLSQRPRPSRESSLDGHLRMADTTLHLVSEPCMAKAEVVEGLNTQLNIQINRMGAISTRDPLQIHESSVIHPGINGLSATYRLNMPPQMGKLVGVARPSSCSIQSPQMVDTVSRTDAELVQSECANSLNSDDPSNLAPSRSRPHSEQEVTAHTLPENHQPAWQRLTSHPKPDPALSPKQKRGAAPPDLNIRFNSPGSPSCSGQVDSSQPDLVLQL